MEQLLTLKEVIQMVGFKKSTIYKFIKENKFPRPLKFGKSSRWAKSEIDSWIKNLKQKEM
ncbi:helix-turn-helix transcriptional regulator [Caminibacter pacificus]